jgi:hypothetical protein
MVVKWTDPTVGTPGSGETYPFRPLLDEFGISMMGTVGTKVA